jgi:class 3 adenylate cyclase/tetratricopeptide (TPR) repeat protein
MDDIRELLARLGLERYRSAFSSNDVDLSTLPYLTDDDLVSLGLSLGHRRKLMAAIKQLSGGQQATASKEVATESTNRVDQAERRQLTVMFCDLVGSTQLSAELDPEDLRLIMRRYQEAASNAVKAHEGFVAKLLGDGILVYFGFPKAKENDCERAVRAGLEVIEAVNQIHTKANSGRPLQVRVGIATGLVVVGEMTGADAVEAHAIVGETPNLAARLQSIAEPGAVVISAETLELIGAIFEYRDLGPTSIAGFESPVRAWQVLREARASNRFDALRGAHMTTLIGRDEQVDVLRRRWQNAQRGNGGVVLISGEPGIGKSRLVQTLRSEVTNDASRCLQYQCSQFNVDKAFAPVIGHFEHAAGFSHDDSADVRVTKLEAVLLEPKLDSEILTGLLRIPGRRQISEIEPDPELRKQRVLKTLINEVELHLVRGPVLLVIEDLQWADASTKEFIDRLVEVCVERPLLLLVTTRPNFDAPWIAQSNVSFIMLNRLDAKGIRALILATTKGKMLPESVAKQIELRTDGIPLFVEELTRSVIQSGILKKEADRFVLTGALPQQEIPTTLHETLTSRLDRMPASKETAQIGAVIGRQFPYRVISAVSSTEEQSLAAALADLEAERILSRRGAGSSAVYEFRHALIQEAAYSSLLKSRRAELHERIARCLIGDMPGESGSDPATVAHHLTEAGKFDEAVDYWLAAGELSIETSGYIEALSNFSVALRLLRQLPSGPARHEREITTLLLAGPCQVQVLGPASNDVLETYSTAVEFCENHGTLEQRFKALWGLWFYRFMLGDVSKMRDLAEQLIPLAKDLGDQSLILEGHHCEWAALSLLGDLEGALQSTKEGIRRYRSEEHHWMTFHYGGHDPGLCARNLNAVNLCLLGYPDQAKAVSDDAVERAVALDHAYTLLEGLFCALIVMMLRRDHSAVRTHARHLIELTEVGRLPSQAKALATGFLGWVQTETGNAAEGLSNMQSSVADWQSFWGAWCFPLDAAFAMLLARQGHADEALEFIDTSKEAGGSTGGTWWEAEFLRVRGETLILRNPADHDGARACLAEALDVAQSRNARLLELRAAHDLAQICEQIGDYSVAHDVLAPVLTWFTEGHDLPDYINAKALMERIELQR